MKTIVIAHNYTKKSFAAMSYYLAHFLAEEGFRVIFISHRPFFKEKKLIKKGSGEIITMSWSSKSRPTGIKDAVYFSFFYFKYKPSIIIGHFVGSNISVILSKFFSFFRVRTLVYYHTLTKQNILDSTKSKIMQFFLKIRKNIFYSFFVDKLICPSNLARQDLLNSFWINKSKVTVVLNPIPDRFFKEISKKDNSIIISYLGRLDESKNVVFLINYFLKFKKQTPNSKLILQIAGEGSQVDEIRELCDNTDKVFFFGRLEYKDIDNYLMTSHYTIIPSKHDNLPTVGLESLMNGIPILISKNTGLSEYCTDGVDSYKFLPNKKQIMDLFYRVDSTKKNRYLKMSLNSRKLYLKQFNLSIYNKKILEILNK